MSTKRFTYTVRSNAGCCVTNQTLSDIASILQGEHVGGCQIRTNHVPTTTEGKLIADVAEAADVSITMTDAVRVLADYLTSCAELYPRATIEQLSAALGEREFRGLMDAQPITAA